MAETNKILLDVKLQGNQDLDKLKNSLKDANTTGKDLINTLSSLRTSMATTRTVLDSLSVGTNEYTIALNNANKAAQNFKTANADIATSINLVGNTNIGATMSASFSAVEATLLSLGNEISTVTKSLIEMTNAAQTNVATNSITSTEAALNAMRGNIVGVTSSVVAMNGELSKTAINFNEIGNTTSGASSTLIEYDREILNLIATSGSYEKSLEAINLEMTKEIAALGDLANIAPTDLESKKALVAEMTEMSARYNENIRLLKETYNSISGLTDLNRALSKSQKELLLDTDDGKKMFKAYTSTIEANKKAIEEMKLSNQVGSGSVNDLKLQLKLLRAEFDALSETERKAQAETYKVGTASKATAEQVDAANATLIGRMNKVNAALQIANNQAGRAGSGFNGLSMAISQLARETPNFFYNMQIGFMAISNNLPILIDEIKRAQTAGVSMGKAFKEALWGVNGAMLLIIIATTQAGKFIEWFTELINKIPRDVEINIELNNEAIKKTADLREKIMKFQSDYTKAQDEGNTKQMKYLYEYGEKEFGLHKDKLKQIMATTQSQKEYFDEYLKMAEKAYYNEAIMKKKIDAEMIIESSLAQVKELVKVGKVSAKELDKLYKLANYSGAQALATDVFSIGVNQQIVDLLRERIKAGITLSNLPAYKDTNVFQLKGTENKNKNTTDSKKTVYKQKNNEPELLSLVDTDDVKNARYNQEEIEAINAALIKNEKDTEKLNEDVTILHSTSKLAALAKEKEIILNELDNSNKQKKQLQADIISKEALYKKGVDDLNVKINATNDAYMAEILNYNSYELQKTKIEEEIQELEEKFSKSKSDKDKDDINKRLKTLNEQQNLNKKELKDSKERLNSLKEKKKELEQSLTDIDKTPSQIEKAKDEIVRINKEIVDANADLANNSKETWSQMAEDVQTYLNAASNMTGAISSYYSAQSDSADAYYDAEAELINNSNMSEDEKTAALEKNEQERYELKKELLEKQKKWEEASAWINFASGSVGAWSQALSNLPPIVAPIVAGVETAALLVTTLANIKSIRAQRIDAPSSSSGSSSSSSATTSYAALSPTSSSITSKEENLNSISNSSSGTTSVVTVSDINNVQNKVSVRDNNTSL